MCRGVAKIFKEGGGDVTLGYTQVTQGIILSTSM